MKKSILLLFLLSIAFGTFAQSKAEQQVADAVLVWRKAMLDADKATLEAILAPELSYGHSSGKIEDKAMLVKSISTGESDFVTMELTEQSIKMAGKTAIVRHKLAGDINDGGRPGSVKLLVLQIWQKQGPDWKLLARQAARQP
ncbi:MAG: nuclear transport factor 2 family protein [Haliscomenobacter sp.]|uniref:nuclear transport factor 2 family protein n=1 Tax=Haliscomenobacter sp. TaxID=2717303 RepID=UPI0029B244C0|nr:nuclear transport factor 2 family protein [Haliscomenobacter sp.]MDX2071634.1 nuclear transport factor 2 family protein [Haliscomenobacter sp.]